MIPQNQTTFGTKRWPFEPGNCLSACVASILELPVEAVPHFIEKSDPYEGIWAERLDDWLAGFGLRALVLPISIVIAPPVGFYVLCGRSVKGHEHAAVAKNGYVVHDPYPNGKSRGENLARAEYIITFISLNDGESSKMGFR
jgi:hypothetical protein